MMATDLVVRGVSLAQVFRDARQFNEEMLRLHHTMASAGDSFERFTRAFARQRSVAVAVKPAFRGRRHGW